MNNNLIEFYTKLLAIKGPQWEEIHSASNRLIEALAISNEKELIELNEYINKHNYYVSPYWVKLLCLKLLILINPKNINTKSDSIEFLKSFADPEYYEIAIEDWKLNEK